MVGLDLPLPDAEAGQALCLAQLPVALLQLLLDSLALRDVQEDAEQLVPGAGTGQQADEAVQPDGAPVGRDHAALQLAVTRRNHLRVDGLDPRAILGVGASGPELRILLPALEGMAEQRHRVVADEQESAAASVAPPDDGAHALDQMMRARLGLNHAFESE